MNNCIRKFPTPLGDRLNSWKHQQSGAALPQFAILAVFLVGAILLFFEVVTNLHRLREDETAAFNAQGLMGWTYVATQTESGKINPDIFNEVLKANGYLTQTAPRLVTCGELFRIDDPSNCSNLTPISLSTLFSGTGGSYPINSCFRTYEDLSWDNDCNDAGPDGQLSTSDDLHEHLDDTIPSCDATYEAAEEWAAAIADSGLDCQQYRYIYCVQQAFYNPVKSNSVTGQHIWDILARCYEPSQVPDPPEAVCFSGETLVLMADGTRKPIQDVKEGEKVVSQDPVQPGAPVVVTTVAKTLQSKKLNEMIRFQVNDEWFEATWNHGIYSASDNEWILALDLEPGTEVLTASGDVGVVSAVQQESRLGTVYNLLVTAPYTYFVGTNGVLVHNAGGDGFLPSDVTTEHDFTISTEALDSGKREEWPSAKEFEQLSKKDQDRIYARTTVKGNVRPGGTMDSLIAASGGVPDFFSGGCASGTC